MHALSLGTWWIHIATVFEWSLAIILVVQLARCRQHAAMSWLALAMLPNLMSALAACTWHVFDNSDELRGLIVLQAGLTFLGNSSIAAATWNLLRLEGESS